MRGACCNRVLSARVASSVVFTPVNGDGKVSVTVSTIHMNDQTVLGKSS